MYAIVTDGSISKYINHPKRLVLNDVQYSSKIFSLWSTAELEAKGIYEVVFDDSNKKDEQWYINTNQSFAFANDTVTASYGSATAKAHADTTWSQDDEDDGDLPSDKSVGDIKTRGLKYNLIKTIKSQAAGILANTDWYITRNAEKSTAIPSAITTYRDLVRSRQATMETQITNASDTPALETLYNYVNTAEEGEPKVFERPLAELPTFEI